MPSRARAPCSTPRCPNPSLYGRGKCAAHLRAYEQQRAPDTRFIIRPSQQEALPARAERNQKRC
jgi:hypothetical protein